MCMQSWIHMWQSRVEIEGYSVTYFNRIAAFEVPYRWTSVKGGAHTHFVDAWISNESTKRICAPPLTEVQRYGAIRRFEVTFDFYMGLPHILTNWRSCQSPKHSWWGLKACPAHSPIPRPNTWKQKSGERREGLELITWMTSGQLAYHHSNFTSKQCVYVLYTSHSVAINSVNQVLSLTWPHKVCTHTHTHTDN